MYGSDFFITSGNIPIRFLVWSVELYPSYSAVGNAPLMKTWLAYAGNPPPVSIFADANTVM